MSNNKSNLHSLKPNAPQARFLIEKSAPQAKLMKQIAPQARFFDQILMYDLSC